MLVPRADDTLWHRTFFFCLATGLGQKQPPSFVAAATGLGPTADASEARRGPRRSATSPRQQVLPNDRTPRLMGGRACTGPGADTARPSKCTSRECSFNRALPAGP
jgi:hypothetical protein